MTPTDNLEAGAGDLVARLKPSAVVDHVPGLGMSACRAAGDDALAERLNQWIVRNNALKYEAAAQLAAVTAERDHWRDTAHEQNGLAFGHEERAVTAEAELKAAREALSGLLRGEYESAEPGLCDCVDNHGKPYQSQFLADRIAAAEACLAALNTRGDPE